MSSCNFLSSINPYNKNKNYYCIVKVQNNLKTVILHCLSLSSDNTVTLSNYFFKLTKWALLRASSVVCQTGTRFRRFQWWWLHDQKASSVESATLAFCAVLFFLTQEKTRHSEYCCEGLSDSESPSSPQKAPSGLLHHPEPSFLLFCLSFVLRICLVWHTFHILSIVSLSHLVHSQISHSVSPRNQSHIMQWVKCLLFWEDIKHRCVSWFFDKKHWSGVWVAFWGWFSWSTDYKLKKILGS